MRDVQIDIEMEIHASDWQVERSVHDRNEFSRQAIEKMRNAAAVEAELAGGYLRTDRMPEFDSRQVGHPVLGIDLIVVASRWWCVMPESFDPERAAAASR